MLCAQELVVSQLASFKRSGARAGSRKEAVGAWPDVGRVERVVVIKESGMKQKARLPMQRWRVARVVQAAMQYMLLLGIVLTTFSCGARRHTIVNPDIDGRYITYEYKITSLRDGITITPSYSVTFHKLTNEQISKFNFWTTYYYGQTFSYIERKKVDWDEKSAEIQELNKDGAITFNVRLQRIGREPMKVVTSEETYMAPDGERLEVALWNLTVAERRK